MVLCLTSKQLRALRVIVAAVTWTALGATGLFLFQSERHIADMRVALRVFDLVSRETIDGIGEIREAQQAYVAAGQGVAFWVAKVATTGDSVRAGVATLRQAITAPAGWTALDGAMSSLDQFVNADKRALEYINASQPLMAGDVIFAEGSQAAATAARGVEQARLSERQAADANEAALRRREALALGSAAALSAFVVMLLVPIRRAAQETQRGQDGRERLDGRDGHVARDLTDALEIRPAADVVEVTAPAAPAARVVAARPAAAAPPAVSIPSAPPSSRAAETLKGAADLATDFGRVRDVKDLQQLLARVATLMDAKGLIVWMSQANGAELRPLLTHGYSAQVVARLSSVPRSASNAAATAYRTGKLQIVPSQPGATGAIVAPILSADGCIGALASEIDGEDSEHVHAVAVIAAAQLAGILNVPAAEPVAAKAR